jgi:cytochrome c551/c552
MSRSVLPSAAARHLLSSDIPTRMAKADLRIQEIDAFRAEIGRCVERARLLVGWSLKQLAASLAHDERQVARWIAGTERAQFDVLFSVPELRGPLVIALAGLSDDIEAETTLHVRRRPA